MWSYLAAQLGGELTSGDKLNAVIAFGTMLAAMAAVVSVLFVWRTVRESARQMELSREALRAQTFLSVTSYEREIQFSRRMDIVRALPKNITYEALSPEQRADIRVVIDFLNHVAHLIRYGYVQPVQMLLLYTPSIEACETVLIEQMRWLDKVRADANNQKLYLHFESLCREDNRQSLWRNGKFTPTGDPYKRATILNAA